MRPKRRVLLLVSIICTILAVAPAMAGAATRYRSTQPNCGGEVVAKATGGYWTCTFDDEFSGRTLDPTKWTAWNGVNYWYEPGVCYYSDPQHVTVSGGTLNLSVTRLTTPATCSTPWGTTSPTYGAAVVHTKGNFSQTGGRFEARIKFAGGVGLHDDFWLYPVANEYPGQAEIDVAEPYGALPNIMNGATHVTGPDGTDVGGVGRCTMYNWAGSFHTYAVEWTSSSITFSYDGKTCYTYSNWTPMTGFTAPAPFDQDFFMILQNMVDSGLGAPAPLATTRFPATMRVDYVRVWK